MKKNIIGALLLVLIGASTVFFNFNDNKTSKKEDKTITQEQTVTQIQTDPKIQEKENKNKPWCITFQLVWNDLRDTLLGGKEVNFIGGNPPLADKLNKKLYTKELLNENSYYTKHGEISLDLKEEIESNIYKKFKETSDVLQYVDWKSEGYLFYAMLLKNFNFEVPFDLLPNKSFNGSEEQFKFFGTKEDTKKAVLNNIAVLFYENQNNFAVQLRTKENEDVILYRTEKEAEYETIYEEVMQKSVMESFRKTDFLSIPYIKVDEMYSFDELAGKQIEGTDFIISLALQTIKFNIDNKGGKLKSEAVIAVKNAMYRPDDFEERYFHFDKPFYLFLKEGDKEKPYYAMYVKDTKYLQKGD